MIKASDRMTIRNRTQKWNKNYTDKTTTKKHFIWTQKSNKHYAETPKKGDDTEIKGHRKKYKHYVETPLITGHRN